ncbi:hypothetical protein B5E84_12315 [Lachnoclostridium sp. An14]|nr:hypothetical protein B5E84_12315 [Lachnoclostridium sp. An14]
MARQFPVGWALRGEGTGLLEQPRSGASVDCCAHFSKREGRFSRDDGRAADALSICFMNIAARRSYGEGKDGIFL